MKKSNKINIISFTFLIAILLPSCITSFHPLFTSETILTDDRLAGTWETSKGNLNIQKLPDSRDRVIFNYDISAQDSIFYSKFYIVNLKSGAYNYSWAGGIVRINNQEFISLSADECTNQNNENIYPAKDKGYEYLNSYSIARLVWKNKDEMEIQFLNGGYIKQVVLQNQARIKYEYDALYNTFIITASSNEMLEFLRKYGNNENLYDKKYSITLKRKA